MLAWGSHDDLCMFTGMHFRSTAVNVSFSLKWCGVANTISRYGSAKSCVDVSNPLEVSGESVV